VAPSRAETSDLIPDSSVSPAHRRSIDLAVAMPGLHVHVREYVEIRDPYSLYEDQQKMAEQSA
jgi:hypothetical protein